MHKVRDEPSERELLQLEFDQSRWDMHKFTREANDLGVRYIGGCCGEKFQDMNCSSKFVIACTTRFEPYHI